MKGRYLIVCFAAGLMLNGCLDEKVPGIKDIPKPMGCFEANPNIKPEDADRYFLATNHNDCIKEKTSFLLYDDVYCCMRPPKCSDYGYYVEVSTTADGTCSPLEVQAAEEASKSSSSTISPKIVMDNDHTCCYHPSCNQLYGSDYIESRNNGKEACTQSQIEMAQGNNAEPFYKLTTGETCCYDLSRLPADGPNCESGWITVSDTEKTKCNDVFTDADLEKYTKDAIAEVNEKTSDGNDSDNDEDESGNPKDEDGDDETDDDTTTRDWFYCKEGKIKGKKCRFVPSENQESRVVYQLGQVCSLAQQNPDSNTLRIHVMDIGQGDSIWIQTPDGKNIIVDGGDGAAFVTQSGPIITDYLTNHGFPAGSEFDATILTHPHSDHFGGFINLFNSYRTKYYIDPMELNTAEDVPTNYINLITKLKGMVAADHMLMPAEDVFKDNKKFPEDIFGKEVTAEYLTSSKIIGNNPNSASIIFKLTYGDISMLFTGDAETAQEAEAVKTGKTKANFLKVCHHGSTTSTSEAFLKGIWETEGASDENKRAAFISSGRKDFKGTYLPDPTQTLPRLKKYLTLNQIFSTSAGDDNKHESQSYRDDNILIVVKSDGTYYSCYEGTN